MLDFKICFTEDRTVRRSLDSYCFEAQLMEVLIPMMCTGIDIFFIVYPAEVKLQSFPGEMMTSQPCIYCFGLVITRIKEMYSRLSM